MPAYIAMLRGINVSGHNMIPMKDLRECCEAMGLRSVQTFIQSGNIVFESLKGTPESLSKKIGESIQKTFGFSVPVILRTPKELQQILKKSPFAKMKGADPSKLLVVFLSEKPSKEAAQKLKALPSSGADSWKLVGKELYLNCPNGIGKSKLATTDFGRLLSVSVTGRNWNTVCKLLELATQEAK